MDTAPQVWGYSPDIMNRKNLLPCLIVVVIGAASAAGWKWHSGQEADNQFRDKIAPLVTKDFALTQDALNIFLSKTATKGDTLDTIKNNKNALAELNVQADSLTSSSPEKFRAELAVYSQWRSKRLDYLRELDSFADALFARQVAKASAEKLMDFAKKNLANGNQNLDASQSALNASDEPIAASAAAYNRMVVAHQQMQETIPSWLDLESKDEMAALRRDFAPNAPDVKSLIAQHSDFLNENAERIKKGEF